VVYSRILILSPMQVAIMILILLNDCGLSTICLTKYCLTNWLASRATCCGCGWADMGPGSMSVAESCCHSADNFRTLRRSTSHMFQYPWETWLSALPLSQVTFRPAQLRAGRCGMKFFDDLLIANFEISWICGKFLKLFYKFSGKLLVHPNRIKFITD